MNLKFIFKFNFSDFLISFLPPNNFDVQMDIIWVEINVLVRFEKNHQKTIFYVFFIFT